jgi:predicted CopG family antitoxin
MYVNQYEYCAKSTGEYTMVTKTVSMSDESYDKIRAIMEGTDGSFSRVLELLVKRGLAYSLVLEIEQQKKYEDK